MDTTRIQVQVIYEVPRQANINRHYLPKLSVFVILEVTDTHICDRYGILTLDVKQLKILNCAENYLFS